MQYCNIAYRKHRDGKILFSKCKDEAQGLIKLHEQDIEE